MPGTRALFPLDGSEPTLKAVEAGLKRLALIKDATATFLVVASKNLRDMPEDAAEYLKYDDEDELIIRDDEANAVLEKAVVIAKRLKFANHAKKVVVGRVYDGILAEAKAHDVLVMHRLDRVEVREKMRGGILEKICRNSPCDVWLINTA